MKTMTKPTMVSVAGVHVNWRAHPPGWVVLNIALATLWIAGAAYKFGLPWPIILVCGVAVAAAGATLSKGHVGRGIWRVVGLMAAAVWAAWVSVQGLSPAALFTGGALIVVGFAVSKVIAHRITAAEKKAKEEQQKAEEEQKGAEAEQRSLNVSPMEIFNLDDPHNTDLAALAANWVARIHRVTNVKKGMRIPKIAIWEGGTGYDLYGVLPEGGYTSDDLGKFTHALASDANLPRGCTVMVTDGAEGQRIVYIAVSHVNVLKIDYDDDLDCSPRSINDPIQIGRFSDAAPAIVKLRQESVVLVGMKGSGKTNLLRRLIKELMRCPDTDIWCIDIAGGGGLVRELMRPYYEGEVERPPIGFPILDVDTATKALDGLIEVLIERKGIYADVMAAANDDKIPVSPDIPQVVIFTDEVGEVEAYLKRKLVTASDIGRASGCQEVIGSLRGIDSYLPNDLLTQSSQRICMGVTAEAEAQYLFGWSQRLKIGDLETDKGRGLTFRYDRDGQKIGLEQFKAPRLTPQTLYEAVKRTNHLRPRQLDAPSAAILNRRGNVYDRRFEIAQKILFPGLTTKAGQVAQSAAAGQATQTMQVQELNESGEDMMRRLMAEAADEFAGMSPEEIAAEMDRRNAAAPAKADSGDPTGPVSEEAQTFSVDVAELEAMLGAVPDKKTSGPEAVVRILAAAGANGLAPKDVEAELVKMGIEVTDRTVRNWLTDLVKNQKTVVKTERGVYVLARFVADPGSQEDTHE